MTRRPTATELRDQLDTEVEEFLDEQYGDEEWHRTDARRRFLAQEGFKPTTPPTAVYLHYEEMVRLSIKRVIKDHYEWTGSGYQYLSAMSAKALEGEADSYRDCVLGMLRKAGRLDAERASRGIKVDTTKIDELIAQLLDAKAAL
jgi:hypothetical protein